MAKFAFAAVLLIACARRGAPPAPAAAAVRVPPQVAWEEGASTLDPSLRGQALALLIRTAPNAESPYLGRALLDPTPWVARQGIEALASRPDGKAALLAAVDRPQVPDQARCIAALHTGDAAALARVAPLHRSDDATTAALCAIAGARGGDPAALRSLRHTLRDGVVPLDLDLARELGRTGIPDLKADLESALGGAEGEMVIPLAAAIFEQSGDAGFLNEALTGRQEEPAMAALDLLAHSQRPEAAALISAAARRAPGAAALYARLLAMADGNGDTAAFSDALAAQDRELTLLALGALAEALRRPDPPDRLRKLAEAPLAQAAIDEDEALRAAAAAALGAPGMNTQLLTALCADADLRVRIAAQAAAAGL
jgi:hypothetical protein